MTRHSKSSDRSFPGFWLGITAIFLASVLLRFWGLGRFNTLVFDEVYFAKFASGFLRGIPIFEGHPPLGTYLIAFGIWLANHNPLADSPFKNGFTGLWISPVSYRWFNAFTGSLIPLVVAAIAYQLTHRHRYALIAGLFAAADGLFLVESRYALINVYLVIFGLLGHLFFLMALQVQAWRRWLWLGVAGFFFGASIAVKWNGLGFLLGAYFIWGAAWIIQIVQRFRTQAELPHSQSGRSPFSPLEHLRQINLWHIIPNLVLIPFLVYRLSWIPFIQLDPTTSFWQWQTLILDYHGRVGGMDAHPYCSPWYTWPLMLRPIAYFYRTAQALQDPVPVLGPPLPDNAGTVIYDVHAMGNPLLWWMASAAIALLATSLIHTTWTWATAPKSDPDLLNRGMPLNTASNLTALYFVLNHAANWLPWARVTRCIFLYHYMGAFVFSLLAIAWMVDRWLSHPQSWRQVAGLTAIFLVLMAFVLWLPMYLGLPLSPDGLRARRWFNTWI